MIKDEIREKVIDVFKSINDRDAPISLYDLGLLYGMSYDEDKNILNIDMTLTSITCPYAGELISEIKYKLSDFNLNLKLVWEPLWDISMISDEKRFELDLF